MVGKITERNNFTFIKGIAIICMVIHHAFGFPAWYVDGIEYLDILPYAEYIRNSARICIPMFVFLTGGGYYLHQDKSLRYSGKKVFSFYISYWVVFLFMLVIAFACGNSLSLKSLVLEIVGAEHKLMVFCWYVPFYAVLMFALPIYSKLMQGNLTFDIVKTGLFYLAIRIVSMLAGNMDLLGLLNSLSVYFPVLATGYFLVKYDVLDILRKYIRDNVLLKSLQVVFGIGLVAGALCLHSRIPFVKGVSTGVILVPMMILGFALVSKEKTDPIQGGVTLLGKYSMNIWFLHGIFFSEYIRESFQPIAYFPRNPVLVVSWILLLCLMVSVPLDKIQKMIV